jgi:DNA repair exonuclease SbcCD nuclease subunit
MKIAITADFHLTTKKKHPERWKTLENFLIDITKKDIYKIIICGDLFNDDYHNYSEFDKLTSEHKDIDFIIIPGNHDPNINQKSIIGRNVTIYTEPEIVSFDDSVFSFLFLPYKDSVKMGEQLISFQNELKPNKWVLISHGDWADSIQTPNPIEPGIYMPLSRKDIKEHKPALTVLGHIHKPIDNENFNVHYAGSPCGLDVTETGRRRYLILDTKTLNTDSIPADSEVIYFDEQVVVYPMENEREFLERQIEKIKNKWELNNREIEKSIIRIKVKGYSQDKRRLKEIFDSGFSDFSFWNDEGVDVSMVSDSQNPELAEISKRVIEKIENEYIEEKEGQPSKNDIIFKALQSIYGTKK